MGFCFHWKGISSSSSSLTTNQETRLIDWSNRLIWKNYEIEIDWFFSNETTKKTQNSKSEFLVHVFCKINWIPVFGFYLKFIYYLIIIIIICFSRFQGFSNQHHSVMTFFLVSPFRITTKNKRKFNLSFIEWKKWKEKSQKMIFLFDETCFFFAFFFFFLILNMEELRMNFFIQSEKRLSEKQVLDVMGYQGRIIAKQKKNKQASR